MLRLKNHRLDLTLLEPSLTWNLSILLWSILFGIHQQFLKDPPERDEGGMR